MTSTLWRKLRADLLASRRRSGLAVASMAVGTAAVGAMVVAGGSVDASFETGFASAAPPSAVLVTDPFTPDLLDDVASHPTVAAVDGRRLHRVEVAGPDGDPVAVELVAQADPTSQLVARVEPVAGAWPPAADAIVLERASATELGADVGDDLDVLVPGRQPVTVTVTGTAWDAYEVAPMLGGPVRGYVDLSTMATLTGTRALDALYLRAAGDPTSPAATSAMVTAVRDDVLAPAGVRVGSAVADDPGVHRADAALSFLVLAMQLLSVLALVIAVSLVVNTVSALLAEQRSQVGVMKAVGATTRRLTIQYLAHVVVLSAAALAVSVPTSLVLGRGVAGFVADLANVELLPLGVPATAVAVQVAIVTLLPLAAVALAVRRTASLTVRDAITDRGLTGAGVRGRRGRVRSRVTLLARRNAVRHRARLALTVLTVAVCGAVLVGVASTGSNLARVGDEVAGYNGYDVAVELAQAVPVDVATAAVAADPAVTAVEGWVRGQGVRVRPDGTEGPTIDVVGVPATTSLVRPTLVSGRWVAADDDHGIVVNTHVVDAEPGLVVGDEVELVTNGERRWWEVVGVASTTLVGPVAYTTADDLAAATGRGGTVDVVAVGIAADDDAPAVADRLGARARDAGLPVAGVTTHAEVRAATDGLLDVAVAMLMLVGLVLAVVAVIGVAGTITLGVIEQTREIGVLRTLGATARSVRGVLVGQGVTVAAIGGVAGVALAVPVVLLLGAAIERTLIRAPFPTTISWTAVAAWLVVALLIGAVGAAQPSRTASRLTVRDTLAYE